jgi:hypothetical protein
VDHDVISEDVDAELASAREHEAGGTWRRWACFVLVGAIIYVSVYAASEALVYRYGEHNRFLAISMAPHETYDVVILGASHALPLGFEDMNERLEERTGARIINLGIEGGGILPARLLLEYFLARHDTDNVLYVLDSFIFYSREWNEARLKDAGLLQRAPLDPALARLLWEFPAARALLPGYLSGFHKINNPGPLRARRPGGGGRVPPDLPPNPADRPPTHPIPLSRDGRCGDGRALPRRARGAARVSGRARH